MIGEQEEKSVDKKERVVSVLSTNKRMIVLDKKTTDPYHPPPTRAGNGKGFFYLTGLS